MRLDIGERGELRNEKCAARKAAEAVQRAPSLEIGDNPPQEAAQVFPATVFGEQPVLPEKSLGESAEAPRAAVPSDEPACIASGNRASTAAASLREDEAPRRTRDLHVAKEEVFTEQPANSTMLGEPPCGGRRQCLDDSGLT